MIVEYLLFILQDCLHSHPYDDEAVFPQFQNFRRIWRILSEQPIAFKIEPGELILEISLGWVCGT